MPNGFMQKDSGPSRSQYDVHNAGGSRNGIEIDNGDAQRLAGFCLPVRGVQKPVQTDAATTTGGS